MKLYSLAILLFASLCINAQEPPTKREKIYERQEFKKLIWGKTKEEVKELIGKPNRTSYQKDAGDNMLTWHYDGITKDKDAVEVDETTVIWFSSNDGKVYRTTLGKKPKR